MSDQMTEHADTTVEPQLADWLSDRTGASGPWELRQLDGGNSNETFLLRARTEQYVLRRPPAHALSASAHSVAREYRVLCALAASAVPAPRPVALCEDNAVPLGPFMVMGHVPNAVSLTDELPATYGADALTAVADELVDVLAAVHRLDWRAAGLADFGRPERFLERQVSRWYRQWQDVARRPLPDMHRLAEWLEHNRPAGSAPALMHGDFHLDNCLFSVTSPRALTVIDWEMATIGDPLLDLGLMLAFWGERAVSPPGMSFVQAVSRMPAAPERGYLLARYEQATGQSVPHARYHQCLALFKLAAITEAAWSQYLDGELRTEYAAALEYDVPALLAEAVDTAGVGG